MWSVYILNCNFIFVFQVSANERDSLDLYGGRHHAEVVLTPPESQTHQVEKKKLFFFNLLIIQSFTYSVFIV
jgi:hypothetical protein